MNKYTELSDFEINKKVAINVGGFALSLMVFDDRNGVVKKNIPNIGSRVLTEFNPCNNPVDAMPIIIDNKITMAFDTRNNVWCAHSGSVMDDCGWDYEIEPSLFAYSHNYYRAAMIIFLCMKDEENNND